MPKETKDYKMKDIAKLHALAKELGVEIEGRTANEIGIDVGEIALAEFGKATGNQLMTKRAPKPRQDIWKKQGVLPRAIDREVVEALHRSTMGVDQEYLSLLSHASKTALADGWGGSMLATELQDILFGTGAHVRCLGKGRKERCTPVTAHSRAFSPLP